MSGAVAAALLIAERGETPEHRIKEHIVESSRRAPPTRVYREGHALIGYFESLTRLGRLADKATKQNTRTRVINRIVRSAIDAFDAHHGRISFGAMVCDAEPLDAEAETALAAHWASYDEMPHELVGDAYQAVDAAVVASHAFCQTPAFVGSFLAEHVVRAASDFVSWDTMRALDPSCGAGHLLLRLAFSMHLLALREKAYHERIDWRAFAKRIIGVELNAFAARIARWQIATWIHHSCANGEGSPDDYVPHVIDADFLDDGGDESRTPSVSEESREELRELARLGAHAVAMNPPYIVEPDAARRAYDRKRFVSAYGQYGLGVVFLERVFHVAAPGAAIGNLTSNAFMKREYGKKHIEEVLQKVDLTHVLDTSGAYIPGHGTPTVILLVRNRAPHDGRVFVGQSKRGEPSTPEDPARGLVWQSIVRGYREHESAVQFFAPAKPPDTTETYEHQHNHAWPASLSERSLFMLVCGARRIQLRGDCSILPIHPHALEIDGKIVFESTSEADAGRGAKGWTAHRVETVRARYPEPRQQMSLWETMP